MGHIIYCHVVPQHVTMSSDEESDDGYTWTDASNLAKGMEQAARSMDKATFERLAREFANMRIGHMNYLTHHVMFLNAELLCSIHPKWKALLEVTSFVQRIDGYAQSREQVLCIFRCKAWEDMLVAYGKNPYLLKRIITCMENLLYSKPNVGNVNEILKLTERTTQEPVRSVLLKTVCDFFRDIDQGLRRQVQIPPVIQRYLQRSDIQHADLRTALEAVTKSKIDPRTVKGANPQLLAAFNAVIPPTMIFHP